MYDGDFENDIPHTSPYGDEDSRYENNSVFDFFDVYVPDTLDSETDIKDANQWHKLDYSVYSESSTMDLETGTFILEEFLNRVISEKPQYQSAYLDTIYYKTHFTHAGYSRYNKDIDIVFGSGDSASWFTSNWDFNFQKSKMDAVPKTLAEFEEYKKLSHRQDTFIGALEPNLLINKLDMRLDSNSAALAKASTGNRRMYVPLLFIRKRAESPTISEANGNIRLTYENIRGLNVFATPYDTLELDPRTTVVLNENIRMRNKNFVLHRAEIASVKGTAYYAKTELGMSSLEAIKTVFREGYYTACAHRRSIPASADSIIDVPSDFIIRIKRVYRDNSKLYVEYWIQEDYKTITAIDTYPDYIQSIEEYRKNLRRDVTEKASGNISLITTGSAGVYARAYGFTSIWGAENLPGWKKPDTIAKEQIETLKNGLRGAALPDSDLYASISNASMLGMSPAKYIGTNVKTTYSRYWIPAFYEGCCFVLVVSYEWIPISPEGLMNDTWKSWAGLTRTELPGYPEIIDTPGISLQFELVR